MMKIFTIIQDMPGENIAQHLTDCAEFIERALSMRCGMVFIASYLGNSRAATIAAAYLMLKKNYSATQALQYMRSSREVQPNFGFLQQLADMDNGLRKDRYRKYNYKLEEIKYGIWIEITEEDEWFYDCACKMVKIWIKSQSYQEDIEKCKLIYWLWKYCFANKW